MWGQAIKAAIMRVPTGIIPTRVGTSMTTYKGGGQSQDHPHACGDKRPLSESHGRQRGSSPRVWGQGKHGYDRKPRRRIIPTRVGTSAAAGLTSDVGYDHPHACGDKCIFDLCVIVCQGSSPRVWGQEARLKLTKTATGIIPTRVGTRFNGGNFAYGC